MKMANAQPSRTSGTLRPPGGSQTWNRCILLHSALCINPLHCSCQRRGQLDGLVEHELPPPGSKAKSSA